MHRNIGMVTMMNRMEGRSQKIILAQSIATVLASISSLILVMCEFSMPSHYPGNQAISNGQLLVEVDSLKNLPIISLKSETTPHKQTVTIEEMPLVQLQPLPAKHFDEILVFLIVKDDH